MNVGELIELLSRYERSLEVRVDVPYAMGDVTGVSSFKDWPPGVEVVLVEASNAYPDEEPA